MKLNKNGFTLVELLAVIVVLALLMVVATRSIGGALSDSKESAIKSEAAKLVSKTYEDIQSNQLDPDKYTNFTYATSTAIAGNVDSGDKVTLNDGDYHMVATIGANGIASICIDDSSSMKWTATVINGNSIDKATWVKAGTYAACS